MRYDANIGVACGTSTPSSYELRFIGNHFDYSDENTNKVPRTTLEGQGTWNLQLNPVLASQLFADYLHYQADNDENTELANAELTAGVVYQPDENFQAERRARLVAAQALGHRHADRRPRPHPGQYRPAGPRRLQLHGAGQHHLPRRPALHHGGAGPAAQRQPARDLRPAARPAERAGVPELHRHRQRRPGGAGDRHRRRAACATSTTSRASGSTSPTRSRSTSTTPTACRPSPTSTAPTSPRSTATT